MGHDARLIVFSRALRTFGYGVTSVLVAQMLVEDGDPPAAVGVLLAVAAAGSVCASILMGAFADRFGRRNSLLLSAALMGGAGLVFAVSESYPLLLAAAFVGTVSPSTNDNTPFSGVEQAILAQTCPTERHTALFARYNMTALLAGALGGLAAAGLGLQAVVEPGDAAFAIYTAIAVLTAVLFGRLTPAVERQHPPAAPTADRTAPRLGRPAGTGRAFRLAGLFAVDAFAGGLAVQAVLALWLQQRYGASTTALGLLFFATNLLSAFSLALAPALAARRGLLQTMLVPHFVSNVLLLAVPASPSFGLTAVLLCLRHTLSKIDVPARQAFTAAVVTPEQRVAAASLTTVARSVAVSASPLTSSLLLSGPFLACGGPLLLGGGLAIAYDLSMWCGFRAVPVAGESRPQGGRHRAPRRPVHPARRHDQGRPASHQAVDRTGPRRGSSDRRADLADTVPIHARLKTTRVVSARASLGHDSSAPPAGPFSGRGRRDGDVP
jgi:predicted MFS family arabinose efflux permease